MLEDRGLAYLPSFEDTQSLLETERAAELDDRADVGS